MDKRKIQYIVIHCTGASQQQTVESIQRHWREIIGWKSPGYHILIEADGTRNFLLPFSKISNGVKGFNNVAINICYIGGDKGIDDRTEKQKAGILVSIKEALEWIGHKVIIKGHYQFPNVPKTCPNFDAQKEYSWITA